jgi:CBS domain-containing protein
MRVKEIMVVGAVTIAGGESIVNAARLMQAENVGMLVVGNGGTVHGVITDRDLVVRCIGKGHGPDRCKVSDHLTAPAMSVDLEADVIEAARLMRERQIKRLPVMERGQLAGVISLTDVAQAFDQPLHDILFGTGRPRVSPQSTLVGRVSHYFTNLGVAGITLSAPLHKGDLAHFSGRSTRMSFKVDSMEINHRKVDAAYPGDDVAVKVPGRARPGDYVYVEAPVRAGAQGEPQAAGVGPAATGGSHR